MRAPTPPQGLPPQNFSFTNVLVDEDTDTDVEEELYGLGIILLRIPGDLTGHRGREGSRTLAGLLWTSL